jgi:nicotinamide riboside kinase
MKVAFIGTHGTGKTTLCYQLAAHLKKLDFNVDLVKEVARHCPLPLNRDTTLDAQRWILHSQIAIEIAAQSDHDVVVCDRAAIDNYAYLVHRVGRMETLDGLVREWMGTYTGLFRVPIRMRPTFDGVRDTSPTFQGEINAIVGELLRDFHIPYHELRGDHPDHWLTEILEHLSLPLEPPQISLFDGDPGMTDPR